MVYYLLKYEEPDPTRQTVVWCLLEIAHLLSRVLGLFDVAPFKTHRYRQWF